MGQTLGGGRDIRQRGNRKRCCHDDQKRGSHLSQHLFSLEGRERRDASRDDPEGQKQSARKKEKEKERNLFHGFQPYGTGQIDEESKDSQGCKPHNRVPNFQARQANPFKNRKQRCLLWHMLQRDAIEQAEEHNSRHIVPGQRGERIAWYKNIEQPRSIFNGTVSHPTGGKRLRNPFRQQNQQTEGYQPQRNVKFPPGAKKPPCLSRRQASEAVH